MPHGQNGLDLRSLLSCNIMHSIASESKYVQESLHLSNSKCIIIFLEHITPLVVLH